MKQKFPVGLLLLLNAGVASAQGLYYSGSESQESLPLKWVVGMNATYDDNIVPGVGAKEDSISLNPYVGLSLSNITPQTTLDVYARLGLIYYLNQPTADGADDLNNQSRMGVTLTHRFDERLRFTSQNFISYELEPDYSYGVASSRQSAEFLYWSTDNSLGYRWSERFATYSGLRLYGTNYSDVPNNDRFTWEIYNQGRYQLAPQTVLTGDYRYSQTTGDGFSSDTTDHYLLAGVEQRFSPTTIGIARFGAQFHSVDDSDSSTETAPYLELALNSQINTQFQIRSFARYGIESYDTVQFIPDIGLVEYDDRRTLRIGISGNCVMSPLFSIFGGIDYIPTSFEGGRAVGDAPFLGSISDASEDLVNAYIGVSVKLTDIITGTVSYNYTNSSSDVSFRDYDRNRFSVGLSAEF